MSVITDKACDIHVPALVSGVTVTRNGGKSQCLTNIAYPERFRSTSLSTKGRYAFFMDEPMVECPRSARRQEALYAIGVE